MQDWAVWDFGEERWLFWTFVQYASMALRSWSLVKPRCDLSWGPGVNHLSFGWRDCENPKLTRLLSGGLNDWLPLARPWWHLLSVGDPQGLWAEREGTSAPSSTCITPFQTVPWPEVKLASDRRHKGFWFGFRTSRAGRGAVYWSRDPQETLEIVPAS